jgi:hypothetical protein
MTHNPHRILNAIRRSEARIQEAYRNNEQDAKIRQLEQEHIDRLRDMLAEPMSANVVEDNFI